MFFFQYAKSVWYNVNFRVFIFQGLILGLVIVSAVFMVLNTQSALQSRGIQTGFNFLFQEAGFDIGEKIIEFTSTDTFLSAYFVAILNTLHVSIISIIIATFLGIIIGIARLSSNILISKIAKAYIEILRNTPQLVQIIFWYTLLVKSPAPREAISVFDVIFISNRGVHIAWFENSTIFFLMGAVFIVALGIVFLIHWLNRHTWQSSQFIWGSGLFVIVCPLLVWFLSDTKLTIEFPRLSGFNFTGGLTASPEFLAILLGLSLYISAFIAEIVRSGIQAIDKGQWEASSAIGLNTFDKYRCVILPQALRIMIPPSSAQYISLVKNSSLGSAIGYPELFNITNTIVTLSTNTIEPIVIMMAVYLTIAFSISILMNFYNKAVAIKER